MNFWSCLCLVFFFFFSSRRRHTRCALVTGVQTCALPILKIAHGTSYEQAAERLRAEVPAWDFDGVHKAARDTWAQLLNRVRVTGGTDKQRKLFYSTLFQSFASPRLIAAKGEK